MKCLTIAFVLSLAMGSIAYAEPLISYGPAGDPIDLPVRQEVCQYGFQDDMIGSGWTLGLGQQLGIQCPGAGCISAIGFYVEFTVVDGPLDLVVFDDGVEVSRTTLPAGSVFQGVNEFDIPDVNVAGTACIMLCPQGNYWSVTGEDLTGPFGNTYYSNSCACSNAFLDNNLTIWAVLCGAVPTENVSWGSIRTLYR